MTRERQSERIPRRELDELGGESEHSVRMARGGERSVSTPRGGPQEPDDLSLDPEDLGRHFLEEATEEKKGFSTLPVEEGMIEEIEPVEPEALERPIGTTTDEDILVDDLEDEAITAPATRLRRR